MNVYGISYTLQQIDSLRNLYGNRTEIQYANVAAADEQEAVKILKSHIDPNERFGIEVEHTEIVVNDVLTDCLATEYGSEQEGNGSIPSPRLPDSQPIESEAQQDEESKAE